MQIILLLNFLPLLLHLCHFQTWFPHLEAPMRGHGHDGWRWRAGAGQHVDSRRAVITLPSTTQHNTAGKTRAISARMHCKLCVHHMAAMFFINLSAFFSSSLRRELEFETMYARQSFRNTDSSARNITNILLSCLCFFFFFPLLGSRTTHPPQGEIP